MALMIGYRGRRYDDDVPLYCTTTDGWVFCRVGSFWITAQSLADAMAADGYVPTTATVAGGGVEIGTPPETWQDHHEPHAFWEGEAGGRDWGDSGVVWPT